MIAVNLVTPTVEAKLYRLFNKPVTGEGYDPTSAVKSGQLQTA
jgi:hypothetical protein